MRLINKNHPPTSLIQYIKEDNASYDDRDKKVNTDLRDSLFAEQFGICAYCQQRMNEDKFTIEHHCERSICNGENGSIDKTLDYKNLLAVCSGVGGKPSETHCDTKKAEKAQSPTLNGLPMNLIPTNNTHIQTLSYSNTGLIKSSNQLYDHELNELLNLNAMHLKSMRKKKWNFIFTKSKSGSTINKLKMERLIRNDLSLLDGKFSNSFPALSEYMQNKFC